MTTSVTATVHGDEKPNLIIGMTVYRVKHTVFICIIDIHANRAIRKIIFWVGTADDRFVVP